MGRPNVDVYGISDYTGLSCKPYSFYFGYEYTCCSVHGNDAACHCDEESWAFVAWHEDKEAFRLSAAKIPGSVLKNIHMCLLYGIGCFLQDQATMVSASVVIGER